MRYGLYMCYPLCKSKKILISCGGRQQGTGVEHHDITVKLTSDLLVIKLPSLLDFVPVTQLCER